MSLTGMSSSSSYSDSSSALDSSSDELVSVGVEGDFIVTKLPSSARKVANLVGTGFNAWLVPLYFVTDGFFSFGALIFLVEIRAGVKVPKRENVNKVQTGKCEVNSRMVKK